MRDAETTVYTMQYEEEPEPSGIWFIWSSGLQVHAVSRYTGECMVHSTPCNPGWARLGQAINM